MNEYRLNNPAWCFDVISMEPVGHFHEFITLPPMVCSSPNCLQMAAPHGKIQWT